jgi:hypothetical protein
LRQELRQTAATRSASSVKAPVEAQVTEAEKVLIRALASSRQIQQEPAEASHSLRSEAGYIKETEFDPAHQAVYVLQNEGLHRGLSTESLVESLLNASPEAADVLEAPASESDRRMLASILLKEEEELTAEILEAAVRALRRIHLRRRLDQVQRELKGLGPNADLRQKIALSEEAKRISLALRDPSGGQGPEARAS